MSLNWGGSKRQDCTLDEPIRGANQMLEVAPVSRPAELLPPV